MGLSASATTSLHPNDDPVEATLSREAKVLLLNLVSVVEDGLAVTKTGRGRGSIRSMEAQSFCRQVCTCVPPELPILGTASWDTIARVTDDSQHGSLPPSVCDTILSELMCFLDQYLLPIFLGSQQFVMFLSRADKACLFGGVNNAITTDNHADAQGRKRAWTDPDQFLDTGYLHGGAQRMQVSVAYPALKKR